MTKENYRSNIPFDINGDSYSGYVKRNAEADVAVNTTVPIFAAANKGRRYCFVIKDEDGNDVESQTAGGPAGNLFKINASSGEITTNLSLKDQENLAAAYGLTIRAVSLACDDQWDAAGVTITLTQWHVNRAGNYTAPATSMVGCTIGELADEIGLERDEFRAWLTFTNDYVTLADGTQTHKDNVGIDTILGANSFFVPNTMYMAWFGEMGTLGRGWMNWNANQSAKALSIVIFVHSA